MPPRLNLKVASLEDICLNVYYKYIQDEMALICSLKQFEDKSVLVKRFNMSSRTLFQTLRLQLEYGLNGILQDIVRQKLLDRIILEFHREASTPHITSACLVQLVELVLDSSIMSVDLGANKNWPENEDLEITKSLWTLVSSRCSQLKKLVLPKELSYLSSLNPTILQGCHLTHLTLKRNVPNNMFLSLLGSHCVSLEHVDIAGADVVTDFGMACLLLDDPEQMFLECWNREMTVGQPKLALRAYPHPHFDKPIPDSGETLLRSNIQYLHLKRTFHEVLKDPKFAWRPTKLCQTLKKIRLENTKVKGDGVALLLDLCPNIYSLGYLVFAAAGLKQVFGNERKVSTKFTEIFYRGPSDQKLQTMANCCPNIQTLFLGSNTLRSVNPKVFLEWTQLEYLTLENVILRDVISCLKTVGTQLLGFKVQCADISLEDVAYFCPKLESLVLQKENPRDLDKSSLTNQKPQMARLRTLEVTCISFPKGCLNYVLRNSPVLRQVKIYSVTGLSKADIQSWSKCAPSLQTLFIQNAPGIDREGVDLILEVFPSLEVIGDLGSFNLRKPTDLKRLMTRAKEEAWNLKIEASSIESSPMNIREESFEYLKNLNKFLSLHWFYLTETPPKKNLSSSRWSK